MLPYAYNNRGAKITTLKDENANVLLQITPNL